MPYKSIIYVQIINAVQIISHMARSKWREIERVVLYTTETEDIMHFVFSTTKFEIMMKFTVRKVRKSTGIISLTTVSL